MSETTASSSASAKYLIGDYFLKLWEYSARSPAVESESEEMDSEDSPSELDTLNSSGGFSVVGSDKLSVSYPNVNLHGHDVGVVQANHPAPSKRLVYYFEMYVKNAGARGQVSIGFTTSGFKLRRQPGWEMNSLGYHGDDGLLYRGHGRGGELFGGSPYTTGDTVGGGINYSTQEFFFTKNGVLVGSVEKDIKGQIFPTVAVHSQYEEYVPSRNIFLSLLLCIPCFLCVHGTPPLLWVNVNFGGTPFMFDLKAYVADQRLRQQKVIDDISIPQAITYGLVRSYLQHYGYEETLHFFDEAGKNLVPSVLTPETEFDKEETAYALHKRMILRQHIRRGEIDDVFTKLEEWYPQILQDEKSPVCCLLHCQKFIELVRKGKLVEAVHYGRDEFVRFTSTLERDLLKDSAALIAYEQPDKSPVGYLMQESQKELLADAVNAIILSTYQNMEDETPSWDACRHSNLDRLIRQVATCVLERRRLNGNEGEGFHLHRILNSSKKD